MFWLKKKKKRKRIEREEIKQILQDYLKEDFDFIDLNAYYDLPSDKEINRFIWKDDTDEQIYTDQHRCVGFGLDFFQAAKDKFGDRISIFWFIIDDLHTKNLIINDKKQVRRIEPQTDLEGKDYRESKRRKAVIG